ncbi:hypothetical protein DY000_02047018 [Brassica cretica]|uniref:Symplekin C-terminal domain-containing protein n=1 Tax=Brassica cretica TaxID=69181 RepID=A0ABQ7EU17_BRACR|nr:hypothetical protein DY000_02047018 [Brassica cretica]
MVLLVTTLSNVLEPYPMVPFAKLMSILATSKGGTELRTEPSSSSKPNDAHHQTLTSLPPSRNPQ